MMALSAGAVEYTDYFSAERYDSPNACARYDTKQSDDEASVMLELWGMQSISYSFIYFSNVRVFYTDFNWLFFTKIWVSVKPSFKYFQMLKILGDFQSVVISRGSALLIFLTDCFPDL